MLSRLADARYASRHGAPMATLVQRRLLLDVVAPDFAATTANALREADDRVATLWRSLSVSALVEVRQLAASLRGAVCNVHESGELSAGGAPAPCPEHVRHLNDLLDL